MAACDNPHQYQFAEKYLKLFCDIFHSKLNGEMQPYYKICILENIVWSKSQIKIESKQEILSNSEMMSTNDVPTGGKITRVPQACVNNTVNIVLSTV